MVFGTWFRKYCLFPSLRCFSFINLPLCCFSIATRTLLFPLLAFFTDIPSSRLFNVINKTFYALPTYLSKYDLVEFINFMTKTTNITCLTESTTNLFACGVCKDITQLKEELYLSKESRANSLFTLYYIYETTGNQEVINSYGYFRLEGDLRKLQENVSKYYFLVSNIPIFNVADTKELETKYLYWMKYLVKLLKLRHKILLDITILGYLIKFYPNINMGYLKMEYGQVVSSFDVKKYLDEVHSVFVKTLPPHSDYIRNFLRLYEMLPLD